MPTWIDDAIKDGPYLAGDTYSLADVAVIPYILRLELLRLSRMWDGRPSVAAWWERVRSETLDRRRDLQAHDGSGRGTIQEPYARPVAQGAGNGARRYVTDRVTTRSGADALGDGYPGGTDPIGVLTGVPAARGSGSFLTRRWRGQSGANSSRRPGPTPPLTNS
jgi:hypothetical protein